MARRHTKITFIGSEGLRYRIMFGVGAALFILLMVLVFTRPEVQYMNTTEIRRLEGNGVVIAGVRDNVPGFALDGSGFEIELATMLAERILPDKTQGDAVKFFTVNAETTGPKLDDASIDIAVALVLRNENEVKYAYSAPYYTDVCHFITRQGDEGMSLQGKVIGAVQGTYDVTLVKSYIEEKSKSLPGEEKFAAIKYFASYPEMLFALTRLDEDGSAKIDAAVIPGAYIAMYKETYLFSLHAESAGKIEYAVACSIEYPAIADIANLMLSEMKKDGSLDQLILKYGLTVQPTTK